MLPQILFGRRQNKWTNNLSTFFSKTSLLYLDHGKLSSISATLFCHNAHPFYDFSLWTRLTYTSFFKHFGWPQPIIWLLRWYKSLYWFQPLLYTSYHSSSFNESHVTVSRNYWTIGSFYYFYPDDPEIWELMAYNLFFTEKFYLVSFVSRS